MSLLVLTLLAISVLISLFLLSGLFLKREYNIERSVIILQPKEKVFSYVKLLKNQDHYNKWWMSDPAAKKTFKGIDGTVGFIAAWDSPGMQSGKGEQEISKMSEGDRIDYDIRFERPMKSVARVYLATSAVAEGTKVTWGFSGKNKYLMNILYKLFNLEKKLGDDMSEGLHTLKRILEA